MGEQTSIVWYPEATTIQEVLVLENVWRAKKEILRFVDLYLAFGKSFPDDIIDRILSFSRLRAIDGRIWSPRSSLNLQTPVTGIYEITLKPIKHTLVIGRN